MGKLFDYSQFDDEPEKDNYDDDYEDLDSKKKKEEIRKLKIGNEKELKNLVEKNLIISILGEVGQSIQNNFVDQSKRKANVWASKLGVIERERDIEFMIGEMIEEGISGVIMDIERLSNEGVFE